MSKICLYLKDPNAKKETPIFIVCFINGRRLKIATGKSVEPNNWSSDRQEVIGQVANKMIINALLRKMRRELEAIIDNRVLMNQELSLPGIKEDFNITFKRQRNKKDFFVCYELFMEKQKDMVTDGTIRNYKSTLRRLKEFDRHNHYNLNFNNIDMDFYEKFMQYMLHVVGVYNNSFGKHIKTLKVFLNFATERGWNHKLTYKKFKVLREEASTIYLTKDELEKLQSLDLTNNPTLSKIRDLFVLQCYTGMRVSDLMNIKPENIKNDFLVIRTIKTGETVQIPFFEPLRAALTRVQQNGFFKISDQKMNEYLKEIGKIAGFDDENQIVRVKGKKREDSKKFKYEMMTTHTARRTFITLADEQNMRPKVIMALTGIRDIRTLNRYIKLTDKSIRREVERVWGKL
ncbi:MAG: site-specific integrase [bacterium]